MFNISHLSGTTGTEPIFYIINAKISKNVDYGMKDYDISTTVQWSRQHSVSIHKTANLHS